MNISIITFSNNTPNILESFLKSIKNFYNSFELNILYYSNKNTEPTYQNLFKEYNVEKHTRITSFKEDFINTINNSNNLVGFCKDSSFLFSSVNSDDIINVMSRDDIFCFSLSLGKNVIFCYDNDVKNVLYNEEIMLNDVIKWNWTKHYLDFGRPLDLSGGHIFHKKEIFKLFKSWKYESLEELENNFDKLDYYPKEYMASYTESKLCNINDVTEPTYEKNLTFDFKNINKKTIEI